MNALIQTQENENGNLLVSGRELHEFLEIGIQKEIDKRIHELIENYSTMISLFEHDKLKTKYELLKISTETYDYFDLIILDSFLEKAYATNLIDEDLTDNKRIPNGSDNAYGRYFEKKILKLMSKYVTIKATQYRRTDAIIKNPLTNEHCLVEIKCGPTDTTDQVKKYLKATGLKKFITVNGHKNSIDINPIKIARRTRQLYETLKRENILPAIERVEASWTNQLTTPWKNY